MVSARTGTSEPSAAFRDSVPGSKELKSNSGVLTSKPLSSSRVCHVVDTGVVAGGTGRSIAFVLAAIFSSCSRCPGHGVDRDGLGECNRVCRDGRFTSRRASTHHECSSHCDHNHTEESHLRRISAEAQERDPVRMVFRTGSLLCCHSWFSVGLPTTPTEGATRSGVATIHDDNTCSENHQNEGREVNQAAPGSQWKSRLPPPGLRKWFAFANGRNGVIFSPTLPNSPNRLSMSSGQSRSNAIAPAD